MNEEARRLVAKIQPGDRNIIIRVPNGLNADGTTDWKEVKGRCVMASGTHAILNLGGEYGTPGVATPENIVKAPAAARRRDDNIHNVH